MLCTSLHVTFNNVKKYFVDCVTEEMITLEKTEEQRRKEWGQTETQERTGREE